MAILEIGSLVQVTFASDLRDAVVTEIDGAFCEIVFTDGPESDPHWVLSCGLTRVYEEKYKPRFEEPARGMYVKIPCKSGSLWATILAVGESYTLLSYEDNTTIDYVVNGCVKNCFMKANHPAVKLEKGDLVHFPFYNTYFWGYVKILDGEYVHVNKTSKGGVEDKEEIVLRGSIVAKTSFAKKEKVEKAVKRRSCVIL